MADSDGVGPTPGSVAQRSLIRLETLHDPLRSIEEQVFPSRVGAVEQVSWSLCDELPKRRFPLLDLRNIEARIGGLAICGES